MWQETVVSEPTKLKGTVLSEGPTHSCRVLLGVLKANKTQVESSPKQGLVA